MPEEDPIPSKIRENERDVGANGPHQDIGRGNITVKEVLPHVPDIAKAAIWLVALGFVIWHWAYFGNWFNNATHVEFPGVKIDRFFQASERIEENASTFKALAPDFKLEFAQAAIVRAERVAPAIKGALVLWVDDDPTRNKLELQILGDLGIRFVTALSTEEAMQRLDRDKYDKYDLIISNVGRKEPPTPLSLCQVHYFEFPDDTQPDNFKNDLVSFNAQINKAPPGGFSLMERLKETYKDDAPPIIFFTATSGGKAATLCSNTITNRVDLFLQSVVSHLEEQRWKELQKEAPTAKSAP